MKVIRAWFNGGCSDMGIPPELAVIGLVWAVWFYVVVLILIEVEL